MVVPFSTRSQTGSLDGGARRGRDIPASAAAFTLIEVILAIVIAVGMLVVVLYFYQQSAELRVQLIQESERVSAVRLLMNRITGELRGASTLSSSRIAFAGDATSVRFITTTVPLCRVWNAGPSGRVGTPETDLKMVSYSLGSSREGSNVVVTGLIRTEQPTVETRQPSPTSSTNRVAAELAETDEAKAEADPTLDETRSPEPVTDAIRHLLFRYWDGTSWKDSWSGVDLPQAVEVTFGAEPMPEKTEVEDYPFDLYRRVIYLPGYEATGGLSDVSLFMDDPPGTEELP